MVKYYEQYSQLIFLSVTSRVYVGFLNYELSLVLTIFHAFLVESASSSIGEWNQYHKVIVSAFIIKIVSASLTQQCYYSQSVLKVLKPCPNFHKLMEFDYVFSWIDMFLALNLLTVLDNVFHFSTFPSLWQVQELTRTDL